MTTLHYLQDEKMESENTRSIQQVRIKYGDSDTITNEDFMKVRVKRKIVYFCHNQGKKFIKYN